MRYDCCQARRLTAVKTAGSLNGIQYLEVSDTEAPTPDLRQRTLFVRLLKPAAGLGPANVVIDGGERIPTVAVQWVAPATSLPAGESPVLVAGLEDLATMLLVRTVDRGDFSAYTLQLVAGAGSVAPPAGFDPLLVTVGFSFKVECPSDFDCAVVPVCPADVPSPPVIDYLAKDYTSFRRLMLDRMAVLAPGWQERNPADFGVALVEALAFVADELSYRQDAVATEAYLATARRRPSLRRHARLVDYVVCEGANARAWVQLATAVDGVVVPAGTVLLTAVPGTPVRLVDGGPEHRAALAAGAETFETMADVVLYSGHARLEFWTWGDDACCLPAGATSATLVGDHQRLKAGDVLVLVEEHSPTTATPGDADPAKRCAVRLTHVVSSSDPSGGLFAIPPTNTAVAVTEVQWDVADALPFPLCVSVAAHPGLVVSAALGNIVLADHGRTVVDESFGTVPAATMSYALAGGAGGCATVDPIPVPVRFRPRLASGPLTHARRRPDLVRAEGSVAAAVISDLDAASFSIAVHDLLEEAGLTFTAGAPVVRGGDGQWSVSDGAAVARLRGDAALLVISQVVAPASVTLVGDARTARASVALAGTVNGLTEPWNVQSDLLGSGADIAEFVVEMEHDTTAVLRFGDGTHGRRPDAGTVFVATYRVGNGLTGNVGSGALAHVVTTDADVLAVTNPLPARGGEAPESTGAIRRDAPQAMYVQQRAVTADDYARMTERDPAVQRAAATFRWTGSWHTVFVTADRVRGLPVDAPFERVVRSGLEPVRMAGYDLEVDGPRFVSLVVQLHVCVEPDHFRGHVRAAVLDVLSSGVHADGELGAFHTDRYTFGQPVYLSAIVAAVQAVPGVESVRVTTFQRQRNPAASGLDTGVLAMGRLEIARLDNDPSFPERGVLAVTTGGGK